MEIRPVSIDQVIVGDSGRRYAVTGEAGRIVQRLQEIDPTLVAHFNEAPGANYFTVCQRLPRRDDPTQTRDFPVMRVQADDWNERIVREFAMRSHELRHGQSAADRLDALDAERRAAAQHRFEQEVGEAVYPLFRAFQRDAGTNPRAFFPREHLRRASISKAA